MYFRGPSPHCSPEARVGRGSHTMTPHEHLEQLLDLVEGRLDDDDARRLRVELEVDPRLRATLDWVTDFRSLAQRTTLMPAPASTRRMLVELLPQPRTVIAAAGGVVDIVARLIRDVTAGPRFAGARGAALDSKRQLLFGADDTDVAIELEFVGDALCVSGQLLSEDTAAVVTLTGDGSTTDLETDGNGEFSTTIHVPTAVQLSIRTTSQHIHLDLTPYLDPAGSAPHGTT